MDGYGSRNRFAVSIVGIAVVNFLIPVVNVSAQNPPQDYSPYAKPPAAPTRTAETPQTDLKSLQEEIRALRGELRQLTEMMKLLAANAASANAIDALPKPPIPRPNAVGAQPYRPVPSPNAIGALPYAAVPRPITADVASESRERSVLHVRLRNIAAKDVQSAIELMDNISGNVAVLEKTNELVVVDCQENLQRILEVIRQLDKTPAQVRISISAFELPAETLSKLKSDTSSPLGKLALTGSIGVVEDGTAIVKSLMEMSGVKLISQPQLIALNRREAIIKTGQEFPIQQTSYSPDGTPINKLTFQSAGFSMKLKPQIQADDTIVLEVDQEIGRVAGYKDDLPIIDRRKANFTVRVRNGQTFVIGRLGDSEQNDAPSVPPNGDVTPRPEYLVFITPKIVDKKSEETFSYFFGVQR